jgi:hypothetical protein
MKNTRALMASITASMFLGTPVYAPAGSARLPQQNASQPGTSKDDLKVGENAAAIEQWLNTNREQAKSAEDIQKNFPTMTKSDVQAALDYLADENRIRRTGNGTKDSPYRYYRPAGHGG